MRLFEIFKKKKGIALFPLVKSIFNNYEPWMDEAFFPLVSIPLSTIRKEWTGKIHILYFNEDPYNQEATDSYNDYCSLEMISFSVQRNKYTFLGTPEYFLLNDDWKEWHDRTKKSYQELKTKTSSKNEIIKHFKIGGEPEWLQNDARPYLDDEPMDFVLQYSSGDFFNDMCFTENYVFYSEKHQMVVYKCQID